MTEDIEDPVVKEIRAVRRELSERFGDDINVLCDFLADEEKKHADRLVTRPPQRPQIVRRRSGK
jgi:rubrerythrin